MREIIDRAHEVARTIIRDNRAKLDQLAKRLLEVETLEGEELLALMASPVGTGDEEPPAAEPAIPPAPPTPPPAEPEMQPDEPPRGTPRPGLAWGN